MAAPETSTAPEAAASDLPQLTEEQIETWTREQKDEWWLTKVFRGDMPQLTLRSAITGFVLGGLLSATNLYVGAKTGWSLGVGLTSVILAFALFKVMSRVGVRDMTILENNAMQSIATAAGYMTGPLIGGMAAFMWIENRPMNWVHMLGFNVVLSLLGVLVAFPMKRRFINDEQQPFPEGRACGVVLHTLYQSDASVGLFKAKALAVAALGAGFLSFISGQAYMTLVQREWLGTFFPWLRTNYWHLTHSLDEWYYNIGEGKSWLPIPREWAPIPRLANVDLRQLGLSPGLDLAMFGAGGLMGVRTAGSALIGMFLNFAVIAPIMISIGDLEPRDGSPAVETGNALFGRTHILNTWSLWWGISIMIVASMVSLFAKPEVFIKAFDLVFGKKKEKPSTDVLKDIELPLWISLVGVPIIGAVGVWMCVAWFGIVWWHAVLALPLIMVLTLIAASSTALTSITPTGSLSKIPQFLFGAMRPGHPPTNLMTAVMCVEVSSNASNLLMDIKPGYMLGGKPRHQAIGHAIGVIAGAMASTPLFYALFIPPDYEPNQADPNHLMTAMAPEDGQFGFPSAAQWWGVSNLVRQTFGEGDGELLSNWILISMGVAAFAGLVFEILRIKTKGKFPISPLAIGLGVVIPPDSTMAMFAGALFFWAMHKIFDKKNGSFGKRLFVETHDPICAGIIAGAALIGIGDVLVNVFVLPLYAG
jgi:uncharacterized oligopeptide transporter (OPT) family protein